MNVSFTENQINTIWIAIWTEVDKETEVKIWNARTTFAPFHAPKIVTIDISEKDRRNILASLERHKASDHRRVELIALFADLALPLAVEEALNPEPTLTRGARHACHA
jgi:hypothetical protein